MKISRLLENLEKYDVDDDVFVMLFSRDEAVEHLANGLEHEGEFTQDKITSLFTKETWTGIVENLIDDDGIWNEANESFRYFVETVWSEVKANEQTVSN